MFHFLLWQDVSPNSLSASFSGDEHWTPYEQANAAFARRILGVYRPGDLIWVHDYHLLLVPNLRRLMLPFVCLGLFVPTPWPSSEVFRCLVCLHQTFTSSDDTMLICSCIRAEGNTRRHARCQYCMLPNTHTLVTSHLPACEYVAMRLLRGASTTKAMLPPSCTLRSVLMCVTCEPELINFPFLYADIINYHPVWEFSRSCKLYSSFTPVKRSSSDGTSSTS